MLTKSVLWINQGPSPARDVLPGKWGSVHMDPAEALRELERTGFDAVVLEFPVAGWTPEELFGQVQRLVSGAAVVIRDPSMSAWDAVRLARLGAYPAPGSSEDMTALIAWAVEEQSQPASAGNRPVRSVRRAGRP